PRYPPGAGPAVGTIASHAYRHAGGRGGGRAIPARRAHRGLSARDPGCDPKQVVTEMGLRLLIASDHYLPFIGGAHRQTQLLAHELHKRGHLVSVATVWHGGLPEYENDDGVDVYRLRQMRTAVSALVRDTDQRHQPPFPDP